MQHREWGKLPNVHRLTLTMQQLRELPAFEALPPVAAITLAGPESHRYVRQDDTLWDELHRGVLTTGRVRGALGLYEKTAAKKLGIPSSRTGHSELVGAYHHLRQQAQNHTAHDAGDMMAAAASNAAAVVAYNVEQRGEQPAQAQDVLQQQASSQAGQGPGHLITKCVPAPARLSRHARRRQRKQAAKAAAAAEPGAPPGRRACLLGVDEDIKQKKARALGSLGLLSVCCSWGKTQEAAALLQVAQAFPGSQLAEVGLCRLDPSLLPSEWGFPPGSLPPLGASPDALIRHNLAATSAHQRQMPTPVQPAAGQWDVEGLLARLQLAGGGLPAQCLADSCGPGAGLSTMASSSGTDPASCDVEVVEVKNTCPFGHSRRGGHLRTHEFAVSDRGPRMQMPAEWVPQLQFHMLCAGTTSGLLVSRSATKGMRIYRLRRNTELLRLMLLVISRLWRDHVLPGTPPPADVFASWREHHDMLRRTAEAARAAELVMALDQNLHLPGGDLRWFLD